MFAITSEKEVVLADDYRIQKRDGKYYCLKGDQTGMYAKINVFSK